MLYLDSSFRGVHEHNGPIVQNGHPANYQGAGQFYGGGPPPVNPAAQFPSNQYRPHPGSGGKPPPNGE